MSTRYEYRLDLQGLRPLALMPDPDEFTLRRPSEEDLPALAELMIDAYRNTIDYDGETVDDAVRELEGYFNGRFGRPLLACSWLAFAQERAVSACLAGWWDDRQMPLISYVMTSAEWKQTGLAMGLLTRTVSDLASAGHGLVAAVITQGNVPSERLFQKSGFVASH